MTTLKLKAKEDLCGRSAATLSHVANTFEQNNVFIETLKSPERRVSAKSLLGILSLGIKKDMEFLMSTDCIDQTDILTEIANEVWGNAEYGV